MDRRRRLSDAGVATTRMSDHPVGRVTRSCSDPPLPARLVWRTHDHHFAPGTERIGAVYEALNLSNDQIIVTVTDRAGYLVYRQEGTGNADGRHGFGHPMAGWDGRGNQGGWNNRLMTPLESPYRVRVEARDAGVRDDFDVHVLYHGIRIALGTWTQDGLAPNQLADAPRWVQYKLNQLGYFAGPIDGAVVNNRLNDQTKRAMRRYLRMMPNIGPSTAGLANFHTNANFQNALANDHHARTVLPTGLPAEGATARLYVDYNLFYERFAQFSSDAGMHTMEAAELDRPELPLEVTITLVGRNDADGSGPGVAAPEAVGPVSVEWVVHDAAEDTSTLLGSIPTRPTRMRAYVDAALLATRAADGSDNCPDTYGGARTTGGGHVNPGYFRIGNDLPPYTSAAAGNVVSSTAHAGAVAGKRGKAGILFRASTIGGDDFRVEARLSFAGRANADALTAAHDALAGGWAARRRVSTGKLVVWRRMPVAAVVDWPAAARAPINWGRVAQEFAHAYIELVHPAATITGAQFLANVVPANQLATFENDLGQRVNNGGRMVLANDAMFQIPIPAQGAREHAREYRSRIDALLKASLDLDTNYSALENYSGYVQDFFKQSGRVGAIIFHGKWVPTINLVHRPLKGLAGPVPDTYDPRLSCIGLPQGLTILNQGMFAEFSDQFAVSHEMGHTRFLRHHEKGGAENNPHFHAENNPSANPADHDTADHNCTMCYPWLIPSRNRRPLIGANVILEWTPTSAEESAFCGKCLLKLRGWNLAAAGLPAHS